MGAVVHHLREDIGVILVFREAGVEVVHVFFVRDQDERELPLVHEQAVRKVHRLVQAVQLRGIRRVRGIGDVCVLAERPAHRGAVFVFLQEGGKPCREVKVLVALPGEFVRALQKGGDVAYPLLAGGKICRIFVVAGLAEDAVQLPCRDVV